MASLSTTLSLLQFQSVSLQPVIYKSKHRVSAIGREIGAKFRFGSSYLSWNPRIVEKEFPLRVFCILENSDDKPVRNEIEIEKDIVGSGNQISSRLRGTISTVTPFVFQITQQLRTNFATIFCIAIAFFVIAVREYVARKSRHNQHGSVADLVKRGQLRSDRRGISRPLKYDDPFNNPLVKVSKNSSSVEMCGKVYRLAPVTLTEEEQSSHQKRRSRAYQWKRPTMFLKEGDSIPPDVDPDTVRWIPANHPFATTVSDMDENLAQNNVFQKHGVPFRIQAEHEALQKKLESLQSEQKLNKMVIDPSTARDFERPFKSLSVDRKPTASQGGDSSSSPNSSETDTSSEGLKKP
ncbi:hypothetical protein BVC80_9085g68 [Macleaya cordata]|uniref:Multiple chloroplast division site 1 n=1 Tax=Macleaya cordata TaxID=56857 RepID=A0A200PR04_MACCD|nr:hypothetical protein BVC80_9085g68 [Macleaya cordata]